MLQAEHNVAVSRQCFMQQAKWLVVIFVCYSNGKKGRA
jgi:hypothetical protein